MGNKSFDLIRPVTYRLIQRFWFIGLLVSLSAVPTISQPAFNSFIHAGEVTLEPYRNSQFLQRKKVTRRPNKR